MNNKKKKRVNKIFRFFDKKIIMPITRIIMKISDKFEKPGKTFENWLTKTNTLLFVSLILSVLIFIVIDQKLIVFTSKTAEVLKDQTIEVTYNEEAYVVEGLPETVDITLMGSRSDLFIAKQSSTSKVTIDLTGLKPGTHKVDIEYSQPLSSIEYSVNPSVATVNIYPKISETKSLTTDLLNQESLDEKLIIENVVPEVDEVVVKGTDDKNAVNSLTKVAMVKVLVDASQIVNPGEGTKIVKDVPLKAYDKNGNILDVEIVPSKISVEVEIDSPSKVLPIKVIPTGEIGFGQAISNIETSEEQVVVYGSSNALEKLEYIPVKIDVVGLTDDRKFKLEVPKPKGVKSMSVNNLTVDIKLGSATDKELKDINIDVKNLEEGYTVQGVSESDIKVTVGVTGVKSVLDSLTSEDVEAYIDLEGYEPGEYEVDVKVEGTDPRVQYSSKTKKVKINIKG